MGEKERTKREERIMSRGGGEKEGKEKRRVK